MGQTGPVTARQGLVTDEDGVSRCWWCVSDPDYTAYHDYEWGLPSADDGRLFEKLCLEGFQAGLSWLTILRKRARFREVFSDFDIDAVARYTDADVECLLGDAGIVRHRGKIASTVNNARRAQVLRDECGSLAAYVWRFEPSDDHAGQPPFPNDTAESRAMSRDLKGRGWTFVGPTTVYAFMQAMGLVDDHLAGCSLRAGAEMARQAFRRPGKEPGGIV
jgi:DNA-3-methyladenine glycosylase I